MNLESYKVPVKTSYLEQTCYLNVFPNPANRYMVAEYNIEKSTFSNYELRLSVVSSDGETVQSEPVNKLQDQVLIITNDYKPGIYFITLKFGNMVLAKQKFAIIRH
jgi:hypothetical protein